MTVRRFLSEPPMLARSGGLASADAHALFSYSTPGQPFLKRALVQTLEQLGGQRRLGRLYRSRLDRQVAGESFFDTAIRLLDLQVRFDPAALDAVPRNGPVLFIANHPFGVLDGVVLTWLALKVRPDTRVMANAVLNRVPETLGSFLPVDFAESTEALQTNLATRRIAMQWLAAGHAIGMFPAGGVATSETWTGKQALDLPWAPFTSKLIRAANPTVVPVHFSGQNSRLFQIASHVSLTIRLSLLMHETARRIGTSIDVAIGPPIESRELESFSERDSLLLELRRRTYALAPTVRTDWMRSGRIRQGRVERQPSRGGAPPPPRLRA